MLAPEDLLAVQLLKGCKKPSASSGVSEGQASVCQAAYWVRKTVYAASIFDEASGPARLDDCCVTACCPVPDMTCPGPLSHGEEWPLCPSGKGAGLIWLPTGRSHFLAPI